MDTYCVFGNPIQQSKSPFIHQAFAFQTNQRLSYDKHHSEVENFEQDVKQLIASGAKGANVTAPFKERACAMCDQLTDRAKQSGAVNTLSFNNGEIHGDNTDGIGLVEDLLRNNIALKNQRILMLGAGGAAKGVMLSLLEQQPTSLTIANRTLSKAQALIAPFNDYPVEAFDFDNLPLAPFDLVINATSAGLSGHLPAVDPAHINADITCYDMSYASELTPFLSWAQSNGATILIDGLGMLVGQAAASFEIWRQVSPKVEPVLTALRAEMAE